ncbi:MAG: pyrroline-5-carboxylate reductase [Chloroflexi bacterium]|nr:pyrroline-5-carboxylate reductase [Chloroflexota bacterium]
MTAFPPLLFVGAGQMAEALMRGVLRARLLGPDSITATDIRPERLEYLQRELGIQTAADNTTGLSAGEVVLIAVKPQDAGTLLAEIGHLLKPTQVLVSIAAGVTIRRLESGLTPRVPVVRVMPNTPALIGAGVAAVALGTHASPEHGELICALMRAVGQAVMLPEYALDAVTALSASGPGFVALLIEAFIEAGVRVGLARDVSTMLTLQTFVGTAQMIQQTNRHPVQMREMVTSPGGTTAAGLHAMESGGVRAALINAVVAATERSRELGKG